MTLQARQNTLDDLPDTLSGEAVRRGTLVDTSSAERPMADIPMPGAPATREHGGGGLNLLEPLRKLAPGGRWMAFGSVVMAALAVGLSMNDFSAAGLVAATSAATLGLLAAGSALAAAAAARQLVAVSEALALSIAEDPDPVSVTYADGSPCAANAAAADEADPAARLANWVVDSGHLVQTLLIEVLRRGSATREFWRQDRGLRVSVHGAGGDADLRIWHFSTLMRGGGRGLDALGMPVLTRDGEIVRLNALARDQLAQAKGAEQTILSTVQRALRDGMVPPIPVTLPDGQSVEALPVHARDGLVDVILLPARTTAQEPVVAPPSSVFEEIPVALVQISPEGQVEETNRSARALLGLAVGEPRHFWEVVEGLGRPVSDWLDDARAGRALGRPEVLRAVLTGQETFVQIILRRAHGAGAEGSLVAIVSDATELKSLEARFVQSQKMQAIGQLAGGIAHDFNNLLTAISGHCDLLLLNRDRFDPDYSDLLQIHQNANRAAALVRQLLAFSRKQTLKPEVLSVESLLEELTHLLTRLVGERITLALSHDPEVRNIRADRRQLEQVLMNLVVNARDAMPMGGTIRIETEARHLTDGHEHGRARLPAGDYALIRVVDQGIGIPRDIIDKIFEPFFTTKKVGEGTGLGLSTAYGIVKQMGGYIFADSVEGAGTTFTLYFAAETAEPEVRLDPPRKTLPPMPAPEPEVTEDAVLVEPAAPATPAATPEPGPQGASVLLVEDEAPVRAFAARALRLQGYQVFEAQDGEQALDFLKDSEIGIDLFVTDVIMPGVDGPNWVAEALIDRPGTPVVFVSGYTEDTLSAAMRRIPHSVFLGKPFSLKDLSETIARQLDQTGVAHRR
ncbi:ATP-binding protein [Pararhodobacter sp. CCB-MM2]|uniref:ATP-binding response regulator n=1 Tax=Pararhodobacter sp. CCB-MM2 TaxID=1786003 RepID=UPI00082A3DE3|nr:ATP-binding protein [Pararhodobacter sp. CCB-MM2]